MLKYTETLERGSFMKKIHLVSIDPQVDFCSPDGALYVKGAEKDMDRLADFLIKNSDKIDDIHVTLDSHQELHIAHPIFWMARNGKNPDPFTMITLKDLDSGVYRTSIPSLQKYAKEYLTGLEKNGRYQLTLWNPHCLIGTPGACIYPSFAAALSHWAKTQYATVNYVPKGSSFKTEHYSAIQSDYPDPLDATTQINVNFLNALQEADILLITGEGLSHCVANTVRDAANFFNDDSLAKKMVLLEDCSSPVWHPLPAVNDIFLKMTNDFLVEMKGRGLRISNTKDFF